jgi:NTE family protein
MTQAKHNRTALMLSGGGARAAYEAGVLKALRELLPEPDCSPFSIYCGTSGGALNAAGLALATENFATAVEALIGFWSAIEPEQVFHATPWHVALLGCLTGTRSRPLFDNAPLAQTLSSMLNFDRLEDTIGRQAVRALCITCSGYASGQSVSFFQGRPDLDPWQGARRVGAHVALNVTHVLASMAAPILFPAAKLNREYFCDGSMRQCAPLSPAIRLGADRIMVVATARVPTERGSETLERLPSDRHPGFAETIAHLFAGFGADGLAQDVGRLGEVNRLLARIPEDVRTPGLRPLRHIDLLVVQPSQSLNALAMDCVADLPGRVRSRLRSLGATGDENAAHLFSYLLFQRTYTQKLLDLGYRDAMTRSGEIADFFRC